MPNRGVVGRGKFSNLDANFPEFITLPVVDGDAILWPISFNGPHIDVLEPRVNPWLMISTAKYSKPTRVDQWLYLDAETQKKYPEDIRTASNGNLLFHLQSLSEMSSTLVFPRYASDASFSTYMGPFPVQYEFSQVNPMYRRLVNDTTSISARTLDSVKASQLAVSAQEKLNLEFHSDPIWKTAYPAPSLSPIQVMSHSDLMARRTTLYKQFLRADHNLELLKAGVEQNPGPVYVPLEDTFEEIPPPLS